jgi:hypothetical protein
MTAKTNQENKAISMSENYWNYDRNKRHDATFVTILQLGLSTTITFSLTSADARKPSTI